MLQPTRFGYLNETQAARLVKAMQQGEVATLQIDVQKVYLDPEHISDYSKFRWPEAPHVFDRLTKVLKSLQDKLKVLVMDAHFVSSQDIFGKRRNRPEYGPIPQATLPGGEPMVVEADFDQAKSGEGAPSSDEILACKNEGKPISVEKSGTNLMRMYLYGMSQKNHKTMAFFQNLKNAGIKSILLYGVYAEKCAKAALAELKAMDFHVILIEDAMKPENPNEDPIKNPLAKFAKFYDPNTPQRKRAYWDRRDYDYPIKHKSLEEEQPEGKFSYPFDGIETTTVKQLEKLSEQVTNNPLTRLDVTSRDHSEVVGEFLTAC